MFLKFHGPNEWIAGKMNNTIIYNLSKSTKGIYLDLPLVFVWRFHKRLRPYHVRCCFCQHRREVKISYCHWAGTCLRKQWRLHTADLNSFSCSLHLFLFLSLALHCRQLRCFQIPAGLGWYVAMIWPLFLWAAPPYVGILLKYSIWPPWTAFSSALSLVNTTELSFFFVFTFYIHLSILLKCKFFIVLLNCAWGENVPWM